METSDWYRIDAAIVLQQLGSNASRGLSEVDAVQRLAEHGANELRAPYHISPWAIFRAQFKNVLIVILLLATALSVFLGHGIEAITIAIIVLFSALLGFVQEYRAERAIEALRQMAAPTATVLRGGEEAVVSAASLVPGDIIFLRAGDKVAADTRLIEALNLQIEEAALTGESVPVEKQTAVLLDGELALGDRKNMAYAGTIVTYGRGRAVVVATGMKTEFGKIAEMLETVETGRTPLQENLDKVGHALARAALVVVGVIVALGLFRGQPFMEMLIFGIALAVAVVPEALPAVVTISLALGVQRMVKRNALVRRLPTVETLGSISVICSDKTGTLTQDEMTARKLFAGGLMFEVSGSGYDPHGVFIQDGSPIEPPEPLIALLRASVLASDAQLVQRDGRWEIRGDPTEGALVVAAAKAGLSKADLEARFPRVHEVPFTSEAKRMTTLHASSSGMIACAKGAPEIILDSCTHQLTVSREVELDRGSKETILTAARQMAGEALRVLAVATKSDATVENAESGMTFLGLVAMMDPPRPEARAAIRKCEQASIKPVMITGDHPLTARAVARELGLLKTGRVVTGSELDGMDEMELQREVENVAVYARVSPAHKLRVVSVLQRKGHVVAMTGDGVNDAPALKKADIGIAMGITGTDVTKEAAAMTLTDDNFASIVAAVEEGRGIFNNIKKYLMYLLSANIGEIGLMAGAVLVGLPLPLTAVQILYVNLATDGLPALALAVDPPDPDLMRRPPRNPRTGIFTRPLLALMAAGGCWSAVVNLSLFAWLLRSGRSLGEAMAMIFVALVLIEFFKAYNFRSEHYSLLKRPFSNKWLNMAVLWELAVLLALIYVPFLQVLFGTYSLSATDWGVIVAAAFTISPVLELVKWLRSRGWFSEPELRAESCHEG
ncbi:MAG: cation-translocating P-type ATPase [Deltaproteobacteria bacterium]|nr:cation-translocating P-type ATPase [Deltaproteobacteria bacterium]